MQNEIVSKFKTADLEHDEDLEEEHYVKMASNECIQKEQGIMNTPVCIICMEQIPLHHSHSLEVTQGAPSECKEIQGC